MVETTRPKPARSRSTGRLSCSCASSSPPSRRRVGELAERSGLPKSTTSRLVAALERQGLVQRIEDRGRLRPGPVLLRYANRDTAATPRRARRALAPPARRGLRRDDQPRGPGPRRRRASGPGGHRPLRRRHRLGRPPRRLRARRERQVLPRLRRREAADAGAAARPRAAATRRRIDELELGLSALAAPVFGPGGDAIAALSISGPTTRLTSDRIARARAAARRGSGDARRAARPPRPRTRCRMTHDEILQGLYDNTLVGNAPEVKDLVERRASRTASIPRRCSTTR